MSALGLGHSLLSGASGTDSIPSPWERLLFQLEALSGEYLFFIGATFIAALLLSKRRWIGATLCFALALLWLSFHLPVTLYLESLGADSFAETRNFDMEEARFWLQTLQEAIQPDFSPKKFGAYLLVALVGFYSLRWVFHRRGFTRRIYLASKLTLSLGLIGLAFHQTTAKALAFYLENTEKFQTTAERFAQVAPPLLPPRQAMDLFVYIGESTSVMNMGLYGYPRPTTPELSALAAQDRKLVVFDHVFATHAHTSRSLLEALSFGMDPAEAFVPITERRRVSVVDVLVSGGLAPRLISNQGLGGSWDQASSVIFKHSDNTFRVRARPGSDAAAERAWDDEFFEDQLKRLAPGSQGNQVVFLHSYAGHGPYLKNIPERFRQPVDDQLQALPRAQILSDPAPSIVQIEAYDAAIRYVDHSVRKTIAHLQASPRPGVLVYFSDHGDAVYAGMGHDSARFRHEMARVPFLMYFNDAAQRTRPDLLEKYRRLAAARQTATLAQLPSTLLDLLGARLASPGHSVQQTPVIGEPTALPPIMVRQTAEGITFVNLSGTPAPAVAPSGLRIIDKTDEDTRLYLAGLAARTRRTGTAADACPTEAGTFEEMSRQIMLLRCPPSPLSPLLTVRHRP